MPDMFKLDAAMDYLRTHPEQHDQNHWGRKTPCGTTMCLAGTLAHLAGYEFFYWPQSNTTEQTSLCRVPEDYPNSFRLGGKRRVAFVMTIAQQEAELTEAQANELFYKAETLEDLERTVKDIANEQSWDKC